MTRNLDRRIELLFPIEDAACHRKVLRALETFFEDDVKARILGPDGAWTRATPEGDGASIRVQTALWEAARKASRRAEKAHRGEFRPA